MKAIHIILFLFMAATVSAHDLVGRELVHYELTNYVFAAEHGDGIESSVQAYFKNSDYTPEGFFRELVYLSECLKNDQSSKALLVRSRILGSMGKFSKEEAENYLRTVIIHETGHSTLDAASALLTSTDISSGSMQFLANQLRQSKRKDSNFHHAIVTYYYTRLTFSSLTTKQCTLIVENLKDLAKDEVIAAEWIDKILCREIPDYAASAERAATLKRVAESPEASDFMRGYMREELRKLGKPVEEPPKKEDK